MTEPSANSDEDLIGYVGLAREDAEKRAREEGWFVRSVAPDVMLTMEWRSGRINFLIVDSVVTRAWKG